MNQSKPYDEVPLEAPALLPNSASINLNVIAIALITIDLIFNSIK